MSSHSPKCICCLFCLLLLCSIRETISISASTEYPFNAPIKYVTSSPPCMAARCEDGIVLITLHIPDMSLDTNNILPSSLIDSNCGPVRIEQLDHATVLLHAGWRVDGMLLADKGREICSQDAAVFGVTKNSFDYGKRLGWGLVDYLVQCHVKDSVRSLSTVGLLATTMSGDEGGAGAASAELYLVDATGLYPCRALAVGSHSDQINKQLQQINFSKKTVEEGKVLMMQVIRDCSQGISTNTIDNRNGKSSRSSFSKRHAKVSSQESDDVVWKIPNESLAEIVTLRTAKHSIFRQKEQFITIES
eukprot:199277_1